MPYRRKRANARFAIRNWEENPYDEREGLPRLTRASVSKNYSGRRRELGRRARW